LIWKGWYGNFSYKSIEKDGLVMLRIFFLSIFLSQCLLRTTLQAELVAYVTDNQSNTIQPIFIATNTAGAPIGVGSQPVGIVIVPMPNGITAYVADNADPNVSVVTLATSIFSASIRVGGTQEEAAATPDGKTVYITNDFGYCTPIDVATNTPGLAIPVGSGPLGVAVNPNGLTAYVVNGNDNTVTPIDVATNTPGPVINVGEGPFMIAITPDGTMAFTTNVTSHDITPIDLTTNTPGADIPIPGPNPSHPLGIAITPDGKTAFVVDLANNEVVPVDIATQTTGTPIPVGSVPFGIAITPDGTTAYVANSGDGTVQPINLLTRIAGAPIPVGPNPLDIAITNIVFPPSNFVGFICKNEFLNKTEYTLRASWQPSPTSNVVFYQILRNGFVVATVPATALSVKICLNKNKFAKGFSIVAVDATGLQSAPIPLVIE
jgi:YVTN family beta-propeller protein